MRSSARGLGYGVCAARSAARALHALAGRLGAPTTLRAIGMPADGLDRAAAALAALDTTRLAFAADAVKIGYVSPQTGPLARSARPTSGSSIR